MNTTNSALEYNNLRLATKAELTDAMVFESNGSKLLVMQLAPVAGPVRAPCAELDAIHLDLPVRKARRIRL
jgi:hypothetical protein